MQGRKVEFADGLPYQPGDYWKMPDGFWMGVTPNGHYCNLTNHVVEESGGTITVLPSILVSNGGEALWHGYLEAGTWRSC